jgi:hypothetical protein
MRVHYWVLLEPRRVQTDTHGRAILAIASCTLHGGHCAMEGSRATAGKRATNSSTRLLRCVPPRVTLQTGLDDGMRAERTEAGLEPLASDGDDAWTPRSGQSLRQRLRARACTWAPARMGVGVRLCERAYVFVPVSMNLRDCMIA